MSRSMASAGADGAAAPVPSTLTSFLSTWLPCGFAVGPSRLGGGRLGLWWVGRSLQAGALLGKAGDTEWTSQRELGPNVELPMNSVSETGPCCSTEAGKVCILSMQMIDDDVDDHLKFLASQFCTQFYVLCHH